MWTTIRNNSEPYTCTNIRSSMRMPTIPMQQFPATNLWSTPMVLYLHWLSSSSSRSLCYQSPISTNAIGHIGRTSNPSLTTSPSASYNKMICRSTIWATTSMNPKYSCRCWRIYRIILTMWSDLRVTTAKQDSWTFPPLIRALTYRLMWSSITAMARWLKNRWHSNSLRILSMKLISGSCCWSWGCCILRLNLATVAMWISFGWRWITKFIAIRWWESKCRLSGWRKICWIVRLGDPQSCVLCRDSVLLYCWYCTLWRWRNCITTKLLTNSSERTVSTGAPPLLSSIL